MTDPAHMDPDHPHGPVRWLLGPDLIANLQKIAVYALSSGKLDVRDWMKGSIFEEHAHRDGDYWFDYIADTGDGQIATYAIARLCLSDVTFDALPPDLAEDAPPLEFPLTLPRGQLLFVGGDTAYHVADKRTLDQRFCAPFRLAAERLGIDPADRRPLLGIPGNHDYYDQLDGYNRQFRVPLQEREGTASPDEPPLDVPGFRRVQEASYVAMRLPHGFWFLGMDTEQNKLDARQSAFFRDILSHRCKRPLRLLVATPSPPLVHGKRARRADAAVLPLLDIEELRPPFVARQRHGQGPSAGPHPEGHPAGQAPSKAELEERSQELPAGELRLYLSGDTHHYARYFGARKDGQAASCASVVSGLGGAFLHPSHFDFGEVEIRRTYPSPEASRRAIGGALFRPWIVLQGGYVAIFGAVVAMALYVASVLLPSRWRVLEALLQELPTIRRLGVESEAGAAIANGGARVGGTMLVVVLLVLGVLAFQSGARRAERRAARTESPAAEPPAPRRRVAYNARIAGGWGLLMVSAALVATGAVVTRELWLAFPAILVAATLFGAGIWQSNRMVRAGGTRVGSGAVTLVCVGAGAALTGVCFFLAQPGLEEAQSMVFDFSTGFFLLTTLLLTAVGLPLLGAVLHKSAWRKLLFVGLGLYNYLLIVLVPFILVRSLRPSINVAASLATLIAVTGLLSVAGFRLYCSPQWRRGLVALWLLLGLAWVLVPLLGFEHRLNEPVGWAAHLTLLASAAGLGALITSASFGWYLAVVDTFRGHDNEVGGAALVERYKQLVRFRLREGSLTAFVIAIDEPSLAPATDAARPRLVDVFEIRPHP